MKHEQIIWNPDIREWVCARCGRRSAETNVHAAHEKLDQYDCRRPSVEVARAEPGTETAEFIKRPLNTVSSVPKTERSGSRFVAKTDGEKPAIQLELFHDTESGLKAISVGFELLSGTTGDEARRLVDAMNERIVGVIVTRK